MIAMSLQQHMKQAIPNTWVFLDNASTIDVFVNPQLVTSIWPGPHHLHILCAAGAVYTDQIADLKGYGTVWFLPNGFANILSLCKLKQKYWVTYDSFTSYFVVHWEPNNYWYFTKSEQGLFYLDLAKTSGTSFVTTVSDLEDLYSHHNVLKVCEARKLQQIISWPSSRTFKHILKQNILILLLLTSRQQIIYIAWNWDH